MQRGAMQSIVVVGAGLAGLTAGLELTEAGYSLWSSRLVTQLRFRSRSGQQHLVSAFRHVGRVVFAGEHTSASGTIDGAIASGRSAARRLTSVFG